MRRDSTQYGESTQPAIARNMAITRNIVIARIARGTIARNHCLDKHNPHTAQCTPTQPAPGLDRALSIVFHCLLNHQSFRAL
jgi:hypothetical protein